jgi:hypothetical protein
MLQYQYRYQYTQFSLETLSAFGRVTHIYFQHFRAYSSHARGTPGKYNNTTLRMTDRLMVIDRHNCEHLADHLVHSI